MAAATFVALSVSSSNLIALGNGVLPLLIKLDKTREELVAD